MVVGSQQHGYVSWGLGRPSAAPSDIFGSVCSVDSAELRAAEAEARLRDYGATTSQPKVNTGLPSALDAFTEVRPSSSDSCYTCVSVTRAAAQLNILTVGTTAGEMLYVPSAKYKRCHSTVLVSLFAGHRAASLFRSRSHPAPRHQQNAWPCSSSRPGSSSSAGGQGQEGQAGRGRGV